MVSSGITPFCIVLALWLRVEGFGLAASILEKDLDVCNGRGRWLSLFLPFDEAIKSGKVKCILSAIASILRIGKKLKRHIPTCGVLPNDVA